MAIAIMVIAALAWSAYLAFDAVQECRKIDKARRSRLANCVEAR